MPLHHFTLVATYSCQRARIPTLRALFPCSALWMTSPSAPVGHRPASFKIILLSKYQSPNLTIKRFGVSFFSLSSAYFIHPHCMFLVSLVPTCKCCDRHKKEHGKAPSSQFPVRHHQDNAPELPGQNAPSLPTSHFLLGWQNLSLFCILHPSSPPSALAQAKHWANAENEYMNK